MKKKRTNTENACLHVWEGQLSDVLNDAGMEMHVVFNAIATQGIEFQWTKERLHDNLVLPAVLKAYGVSSTTKLGTTDIHDLIEHLNRWIAQTFGIVPPPYPSNEPPMIGD